MFVSGCVVCRVCVVVLLRCVCFVLLMSFVLFVVDCCVGRGVVVVVCVVCFVCLFVCVF